jgi:hypothetical protein
MEFTPASPHIVLRTDEPSLTSILKDGLLHKSNSKWRQTYFSFLSDGVLTFSVKAFFSGSLVEYHRLDVSTVTLVKIDIDEDVDESMKGYIGIKVKCKDLNHIDTYFRVVFSSDAKVEQFLNALSSTSTKHNVEIFRTTISSNRIANQDVKRRWKISIMRKGIRRVLNKAEKRSILDIVRSR